MIRLAVLMLAAALTAAPAAAQQGSFGLDSSSDRGTSGARSREQERGRSMEQERSGGQALGVSAAAIILPSFASLRGRGLSEPWIDVCRLANKSVDKQAILSEIELEQRNYFTQLAEWASRKANEKKEEIQLRESYRRSPLEDLIESTRAPKPVTQNENKKAEFDRLYASEVAKINAEVAAAQQRSDRAKEENKQYVASVTPSEAELDCLGSAASYVTRNAAYWPQDSMFNVIAMRNHARNVTVSNIALHRLGAKIATRMKLIDYKDHDVAFAASAEMARKLATETVAEIAALKRDFDKIDIFISMDGKCGSCFTATMPNGQTYAFEGTNAGWNIAVAGGPWGGNGWLAGARVDIAFSERGVATVTQVEQAIQRSEMTWTQRLGTGLGFGK